MAKLKLVAEPTFKALVPIPLAGGETVDVEMTFKHRTKTAFNEWVAGIPNRTDIESFFDMVEAWELEDPFTRESVELLFENYIGAPAAIYLKYREELEASKRKN